jgi:hypothetical protein
MAIPKKGSRKIVVDNVAYRWRIRWKISDGYEAGTLNAAVELYENPQSVLHIIFPWVKYEGHMFVAESVTPKHIEFVIRKALKEGWQPKENKNIQVLQEERFIEFI